MAPARWTISFHTEFLELLRSEGTGDYNYMGVAEMREILLQVLIVGFADTDCVACIQGYLV